MAYETIIVEIEDYVATIRLNRPDAMNALNDQLFGELADALGAAQANEKVRCIVLTGSEKFFAAGADIKMMSEMSFVDVFAGDLFTQDTAAILRVRKPIIAAVAGYALGGGCELAMMCDMIIASDKAKFGQPEIKLGVTPGMGGSIRLTKAVGKAKAMDMVLTGRMIDAAEADRIGLVSRVVEHDALMDTAMGAAKEIAGYSIPSIMAAKEMVGRALEVSTAEGVKFERRLFQGLFGTADQKEGMAAFTEKRAPDFKDK